MNGFFNSSEYCHLSFGAAVSLVVANVVIGACGFILNFLIILALALDTKLRNDTTNILLGSLAVADLIINSFGQPAFCAQVIYTYRRQCKDTWAFHAFTISCSTSFFLSMLCLTMVTIERFLAVKAPIIHRTYLTRKRVHGVILLIVLATVGYGSYSFIEKKAGRREFTRAWIFSVFCFTAIVMNICTMIFTRRFLQKRYRESQSRNTAEHKGLKAKIRRVTLLLVLLVMAIVTWMFVIVIVVLFYADLLTLSVVYVVLTIIFLNSCLNPIAYCLMAPDIRKATKHLIRRVNPFKKLKRQATQSNGETQLGKVQPGKSQSTASQRAFQIPIRNNFVVHQSETTS